MAPRSVNTIARTLIQTVVRQKLNSIKSDPERSLRNLVDMGLSFAGGGEQKRFLQQAQRALQDENSYLNGKLTAKTVQEVDSYAAAQGLCKVQSYQVSYIRLNDSDVAVRTEAAPSGSALESLMDSMDTALEYLRIK